MKTRKTMKTMAEEWEHYLKTVYPDGVSAVQEKECKQAFYAGALSHHVMCVKASDLPENKALELMDKIESELMAYAESRCGDLKKCEAGEPGFTSAQGNN